MKNIRELGVKLSLVFNAASVLSATKLLSGMSSSAKTLALGIGSAASSILGLTAAASENSRDLDQNSKALGINVESLEELQYAASVAAGVSKEELTGALEGLSKTLFEARNNNVEAGQTLIRLGLPIDMLTTKGITADQVMRKLSDSISELPDGMYKTALAQEAFGGSGAKLLPLLNKGAEGIAKMGKEGRALGVILSEDMIKKGAEFDRQWTKIWLVMKNISYLIGHELIKYLYPLVLQFQKWIVANRQLIAMGLAVFFKTVGDGLTVIFKVALFLANGLKQLATAMGGVANAAKLLTAILIGVMAAGFGPLGLVIAGFFLIMQDLFSKDSLIKEWAASFSTSFPGISKIFQGLLAQILVLPERIVGAFNIIKEAFEDTVQAFKDGFGFISKVIGAITNYIPGMDKVKSKLSGIWDSVKGGIASAPGAIGGALTQNAQARVSPGYSNPSLNQNNQMTANVTVTVPRGTSPADAEKMVSKGTEQGFAQTLRHTRNQFLGGLAY